MSWRSRFRSVLAEIVYQREHVLDGAAEARHLQVSGGWARGGQLAPAPYEGLFPSALSVNGVRRPTNDADRQRERELRRIVNSAEGGASGRMQA